jgi:non-ribosomal peptide synthetase component F
MSGSSVQRLIEQQAAATPASPALMSESGTLSYRDLNLRANAIARRLAMHGLRRGGLVTIKIEKSPETAIILLAVLKAGAAYMMVDPVTDSTWPRGLSICEDDRLEQRWRTVDVASLLAGAHAGPGLPVLTRPTDIACVLPQAGGRAPVLVPHETIITLMNQAAGDNFNWGDDTGALDLWVGLMSGATVSVVTQTLAVAAA